MMDAARIKLSIFRRSRLAPADILPCSCEGQMAGAARIFYYSTVIVDAECHAFADAIPTSVSLLLLMIMFFFGFCHAHFAWII